MQHVFAMANHVTALLNGATDPDPSQHGMTTEEERASSSKPQVMSYVYTGFAFTAFRWVSCTVESLLCHSKMHAPRPG